MASRGAVTSSTIWQRAGGIRYNTSNMKLLDRGRTAADCAGPVLDVALLVVRLVRAEIRRSRPAGLSLNQLRALSCVKQTPDASLSLVADSLGLALPSASHLVNGLVRRGMLERRPGATDRRRLRLTLTRAGRASLDRALAVTRRHVADRLAPLTPAQRTRVIEAMNLVKPLVAVTEHAPA